MKLSQFKFKLPEEQIALYPAKNRDESRLMVINRKAGTIEHHVFKEIINYYDDKDLFVFNDTRVFPARLIGNKEKTGAKIEVFLLRELNEEHRLWDVLVEPARKIRIGNKLYFGEDDSMVAEVIDNTTSRGRTLRFLYDGPHDEFKQALYQLGETPLPMYINRDVEPEDAERYQCIFARHNNLYQTSYVGNPQGLNFSVGSINTQVPTFIYKYFDYQCSYVEPVSPDSPLFPDDATGTSSIEYYGECVGENCASSTVPKSALDLDWYNEVDIPESITNLFLLPFRLISVITNDSVGICQPIEIDLSSITNAWGGDDYSLSIPCMRTYIHNLLDQNILGNIDIYNMCDLFMAFGLSIWLGQKFYFVIMDMLSGNDLHSYLVLGSNGRIRRGE